VTRRATAKLHAYLALVAALLVAAFAARRPEMAVVAAPFALALAVALAADRGVADVEARVEVDRDRVLEGESLALTVEVEARRGAQLVDVAVVLPDGLAPALHRFTVTDVEDDGRRSVPLEVACVRWGAHPTARCAVRARAAAGLFRDERVTSSRLDVRVYPRAESLRRIIAPRETKPYAGNRVARAAGEGIEFAGVRPFQPGDELRHVNWRATARRGETWVSARHPERNADVVLFLDTFGDVRPRGTETLELTVRAAAALAARYLEHRERVGVVGFGGSLSWLVPGSGRRHLYQIVESLIATELSFSYAWKGVSVIPRGTLPAQALVIAVTPLLDDRAVQALFDLLRRGFDVAVLDVADERFVPPARGATAVLARRIWRLERAALLDRYRALGAAVTTWSGDRPLDAAVEEVGRFRRSARIVAVS
jgi:uncharacterized protein (DUF58 family)